MKFFFVFLISSLCLFSNENDFQSAFPITENYLNRFEKKLKSSSDVILLKTLPRSGTNIVMAILNQLTGKICLWNKGNQWERGMLHNRARLDLDDSAFPILGCHNVKSCRGLENNILITTIRNYKEWFPRKHGNSITNGKINTYMNHLQFFDQWKKGKKFLVRFEDVLDNPSKVICALAKFLNASDYRRDELLDFYPIFSKRVFNSYKGQMGTENHSLKKNFHRNVLSEEELKSLEKRLKKANSYLFNKYLKVYSHR